ncbi:MAG: agmatinase [Candidatus Nanopelagicales bacterium]|nr:agmatinase [Candidatus Nanopelagicales bacterium]
MTRYGAQFGPNFTFLGVPECDVSDPASYESADIVIVGAPFDGGTSFRAGARFGPQALRAACYLEHDGRRPSLALRVDGLSDMNVVDAGDVEMYSGDAARSCADLEKEIEKIALAGAIPVILGGDHTVTWPDVTGVARARGWGKISVIHFDAHADTGDITFGSLIGHGQPMRRLIESGAVRGDRFLQVGLRGYWPEPETLQWMAEQGMRSYEMTEIVTRGLNVCLDEIFQIALSDCDAVFLSVDIDVCDPGHAPGTGTPEPGGLSARELLDAVRKICYTLPIAGMDIVEVAPPYDHADITAMLGNRVVLEALSAMARRRQDSRAGTTWDPSQPLLSDRIPGENE